MVFVVCVCVCVCLCVCVLNKVRLPLSLPLCYFAQGYSGEFWSSLSLGWTDLKSSRWFHITTLAQVRVGKFFLASWMSSLCLWGPLDDSLLPLAQLSSLPLSTGEGLVIPQVKGTETMKFWCLTLWKWLPFSNTAKWRWRAPEASNQAALGCS